MQKTNLKTSVRDNVLGISAGNSYISCHLKYLKKEAPRIFWESKKCSLLSCKSKSTKVSDGCKEVFFLFFYFRIMLTNFISFFCINVKNFDYTVKKCIL